MAVHNLARWLTRNERDAEDVVQEACLRAFKFLDGFRGGNSRAWFLAIVRNTYYSGLKKNRFQALNVPFDEDGIQADNTVISGARRCQATRETGVGSATGGVSRNYCIERVGRVVLPGDYQDRTDSPRYRDVAFVARPQVAGSDTAAS